jgi:transposase
MGIIGKAGYTVVREYSHESTTERPVARLADGERASSEQAGRATDAPAVSVARAGALLAATDGCSYTEAARRVGRRSGDAVAAVVARFNGEGLAAVEPRHGGVPRVMYGVAERERILTEVKRAPDREQDGTATWSLRTLQPALRRTKDGLPRTSTYTIGVCCTRPT